MPWAYRKQPHFLSSYMTIFAKHQTKDFSQIIFPPTSPEIAWPTERKASWLQHWAALKQLLNLNWTFLFVWHYYKPFSGLELLHINSILWALETNWKAGRELRYTELFQSILEAKIMEDFFHFDHSFFVMLGLHPLLSP